jgi:hypothetical protein
MKVKNKWWIAYKIRQAAKLQGGSDFTEPYSDFTEPYTIIRLVEFPNGSIKKMSLTSPWSEWKEIK